MPKRIPLKATGKMRVVPMHAGEAVTIDEAIAVLEQAKQIMGGDRCLILSLSGSGIEDANVNSLHIACDTKGESGYVEVRVSHPSLPKEG